MLYRRNPLVTLSAAAIFACAASCTTVSGAGDPWPGETWSTSSDLTFLNPSGWSTNLSGAYWNPVTRRLWVANNSGNFSVLKETAGSFTIERTYSPGGDLEGITQVDPASAADRVYLMVENAEDIRAYSISSGTQMESWDLTPTIGALANSGTEGIAFIPNVWLAASGFRDKNGSLYPNSVHGANGIGGIMLVAVQTAGYVYAVDLKKDGTHTFVGKYKTSRNESCDLAFDASIGRLYILHNIDGNILEVTDLTSTTYGADRKFTTLREFQVPSDSNIEGFAITPALKSDKTLGDGWCFFTDDNNASGALRWFKQLPSPISIHAGNNQSAIVSTAVPIPPSVLVLDAFKNPLPGFAVTFAVGSGGGFCTGANTTTQPSGVATVGSWTLGPNPGANTLLASGVRLGGSPLTFNATAPVDANNNGMPDAWETTHFGSTTNPLGAANYDWDHDGQDNLHEYLAGTTPTDPASVFKITSATMDASGKLVLRWPSVSGKSYGIQASTDLHGFQNTTDAPIAGTGGILTKSLSIGPSLNGFYRIVVIP